MWRKSIAAGVLTLGLALGAQGQAPAEGPGDQPPPTVLIKQTSKANKVPVPALKYELLPTRDLAKGDNAVLYIQRAQALMSEMKVSVKNNSEHRDAIEKVLSQPVAETKAKDLQAFVDQYRQVYKELEVSAQCRDADWGIEKRIKAEGIGTLLPEVQSVRNLAFVLKARSRYHLVSNDLNGSLKDIQTGFALARHTAGGSTLIQYLVGAALLSIFTEELDKVMQHPECPNLYYSLTALPQPILPLQQAIDGEKLMITGTLPNFGVIEDQTMSVEDANRGLENWLKAFNSMDLGGKPASIERLQLAAFVAANVSQSKKYLLEIGKKPKDVDAMPSAQVVLLASFLRFRHFQDESFLWYQLPPQEALKGLELRSQKLKELKENSRLDMMAQTIAMLTPAMDKIYQVHLRHQRRLAALRTVEAVKLHYAATGKLPEKLADISVVPVPVDVVTSKSFEYTVKGNEFTVYIPPVNPKEALGQHNNWKYIVTIQK